MPHAVIRSKRAATAITAKGKYARTWRTSCRGTDVKYTEESVKDKIHSATRKTYHLLAPSTACRFPKEKAARRKVTVAALPKNTNTPLPGGTPIQQSQLTSIRWTRRAAAKESPNSRPCLFQRNECRAKKGGQSSSGICQTEPEKRDARGSGERCLGAVNTSAASHKYDGRQNRLATSATPIQNFAGLDRIFCASAPSHEPS
jgi:hypothetical protein